MEFGGLQFGAHTRQRAAALETPFLFLGNIQPSLQKQVREQVGAKLVAADTMNYWIHNTPDELREMLRVIDVLIINDSEARELAGEANLIRAARRILSMGPKRLVVKRGEYGAAMFSDGTYFATPAYPLDAVFDPTGAGDTFAGGFMGYLAATDSTDESAMRQAIPTTCGSVRTGRSGIAAISASPTRRATFTGSRWPSRPMNKRWD